MRYIIAALLMVGISPALYGQAMDYLGIRIGAYGLYSGYSYDSTYIPGAGSSVTTLDLTKSLHVNEEFTYSGYLGRGILDTTIAVSGGTVDTTIFVDTVYDVSNTLHRLMVVGKTDSTTYLKVDVIALVTPFLVGNSWVLGIAGDTLAADIDGDTDYTNLDTLIFNVDSAYVTNMGNMTVTAGTFDSVYTINLVLRGVLWSSIVYNTLGSSYAWSDSVVRYYTLYWRPGIGYIKDSMYQYASWNLGFFGSASNTSVTVHELTDYTAAGVSERTYSYEPSFLVSEGGILLKNRSKVYDVTGRVVFYGEGFVKLRRGMYLVREGDRTYKVLVR